MDDKAYDILLGLGILVLVTGIFLLAAAFDKILTYHGL